MTESHSIRPFEVIGDIWHMHNNRHRVIVIPTNGTVTVHKKAVMGRGLAYDATQKYPDIKQKLGKELCINGNHVHYFKELMLITFPVKYEWWEFADLSLIQRSTEELQRCILTNKLTKVYVPRVGCGNGGLTWDRVKPILQEILDHRCTLVSYRKELA